MAKELVKANIVEERVLTENSDAARELYDQSRFGKMIGIFLDFHAANNKATHEQQAFIVNPKRLRPQQVDPPSLTGYRCQISSHEKEEHNERR